MEGLIEEQVKQVDQVIFFILISFNTRKSVRSVDVNHEIELIAFLINFSIPINNIVN
jgi:hypothetical protein